MPKEKWKMDHLVAMMEYFQTIRCDVALSEYFDGAKAATDNLFQNSLSPQAGAIIVPASVSKKFLSDLRNCDVIRDIYRAFNQFVQRLIESGPYSAESEGIRKLISTNLGRIFGPENDKMISGPIPSD